MVVEQGSATTIHQISIGRATRLEGKKFVKLVVGEVPISDKLNGTNNGFFKHLEDEDKLLGSVRDRSVNGANSPQLLKALDVLVDCLVLIGLAGLGTDFGKNGRSCDPAIASNLNFGDDSALKIRGSALSKDRISSEPSSCGNE